jgi:hypothetical protein
MNKDETVFLMMWILGVLSCMGVEVYAQYYENISGLGFIIALLLIPLLQKDLARIK